MFAQAPGHCDNKPRQIGFNHDNNMAFSISHECQYSLLKIRIWCSKQELYHVLLPLLRHVVPLNDRNCCLTIPVVNGRCARDALRHTFGIGMFKSVKKHSSTIKHIYNESANIFEGCNVAFGTNNC